MQTAVERLRASKMKHEVDERTWGRNEGLRVAKDLLVYDQLLRIEAVSVEALGVTEGDTYQTLKDALDPEGNLDDSEFAEAYFTNDGEAVSDLFALGFIEGAQEFFSEVKDQL